MNISSKAVGVSVSQLIEAYTTAKVLQDIMKTRQSHEYPLTAADLERAAELILQGWAVGQWRMVNTATGERKFCAIGAISEAVSERLNVKATPFESQIVGFDVFSNIPQIQELLKESELPLPAGRYERDARIRTMVMTFNDIEAENAQEVHDLLMDAAKILRNQGE